jgi:two-component system cell cycle sensor histidine kinase/response regulator CckA
MAFAALAVPAFLVARAARRDRAFRRGLAAVAVFAAACGSAQLLRTVPLAAPDSPADGAVKFAAAVVACGAAAVLLRRLSPARPAAADAASPRPPAAAARAAREGEERLRRMFEDSPVGIYRATPDGRVVVANPAALAMIGCRPADAFGGRGAGGEGVPDAAADGPPGVPTRSEFSWQRPDGTVVTIRETVRPVWGAGGTVRYYEATLDDVTDWRKAEDRLREREALLRNVIDHIPGGVYWKDRDSVYLGCNDRFAKDQGLGSPADVVGRTDRELPFGPVGVPDARATDLQVIETGEPILNREGTHTRAGGDAVLLTSTVPLWNHTGQVIGVLGTYLDLTERKRLEEQFHQAQKMEAVGRLAGGIAHEFDNLLAAIRGNVDAVRTLLCADPGSADRLDGVRDAADRAAGLVRQLLTFARREPTRPEVLDLNEVVSALSGMLRRWLGAGIALAVRPSTEAVRVRADRGHLEQVVLNLVANARDAMPGGGTLTLTTELVREPHAGLDAGGGAPPAVRLSVADTGCGMTDEVKARAFEPFFSTKGPEAATGLGLATVYGTVQRVGGRIRVVSVPGRGTAVHVDLPLCDAAADRVLGGHPRTVAAPAARPGGPLAG